MTEKNSRKLTRREKLEKSRQTVPAALPGKKFNVSKNKLKLHLGLIAAGIGILLYIGTINYQYTLDDFQTIKKNQVVQKGFSGIGTLLTTSYRYGYWASNDELYRPLSLIMFAIEWQIFPDFPPIGHIISILLYALTGILLFNLLSRLFTNNLMVAFIATLLFMAHPAHTEVVANIKSRDEILSFLLGIVCIGWLLDYLETKKANKIIVSSLAFFLALMAKESGLSLLAIIPLLLFVFKNVPLKKGITKIIPLIGVAIVYLLMRTSALHGIVNTKKVTVLDNVLVSAPDFFTRFITAMYVLGKYLLLLVFPNHLSIDYSYSEITLLKITDYRFIISLIIYLALFIYAIIRIKKKDIIAFSIFYFLISISIVSNIIIIIGTVMADRLLYAPSLALCLVIGILLTRIFNIQEAASQVSKLSIFLQKNLKPFIVTGVILVLYSFKTVTREKVWENDMELFKSGVKDSPNSSRCQYLLGLEIKDKILKKEKDSAKLVVLHQQIADQFKKAIGLCPYNFDAYRDLGENYDQLGDTVSALENYDMALKYYPYESQSLNNKAVMLYRKERYKEAMEMFKLVVYANPRFANSWANLGSCYAVLADYDNAISCFKKSLEYETDDLTRIETCRKIGLAYQYIGDQPMANTYMEKSKEQAEEYRLKNLKE